MIEEAVDVVAVAAVDFFIETFFDDVEKFVSAMSFDFFLGGDFLAFDFLADVALDALEAVDFFTEDEADGAAAAGGGTAGRGAALGAGARLGCTAKAARVETAAGSATGRGSRATGVPNDAVDGPGGEEGAASGLPVPSSAPGCASLVAPSARPAAYDVCPPRARIWACSIQFSRSMRPWKPSSRSKRSTSAVDHWPIWA